MGQSKRRREANPDTYGTMACPGAGYLPNLTRQTGLTKADIAMADSGPSSIAGRVTQRIRRMVQDQLGGKRG